MTNEQVKTLAKYYKGGHDYPFFDVGFEMGFYKALDWLGVKVEDVKIPEDFAEFFRRKESNGASDTAAQQATRSEE